MRKRRRAVKFTPTPQSAGIVPRRKLPYSMPQTMPTTSGEKPSWRMAGRSASCITAPAIKPTNSTPFSLSRHGVVVGAAAGAAAVAPAAAGRGTVVLEEVLMTGPLGISK